MTKPQIRLLLVDDDLVDRMACRRALAQNPEYEFVLSEAETGREGLRLAHAQKPECVLLDYHLPDLNGLEFLAELRNNQDDIPVPVIMLTGTDNASVAVEAMKRGAQDYLIKDANRQYLELLPAVIQRVLREQLLLREKKQVEENLILAEEKYRFLVEQIPAIIYTATVDAPGKLLYISPQIRQLGFSPEEWLADPEGLLKQIHPEDRTLVSAKIAHIYESSEPLRCEYRLFTRAGEVRWFLNEAKLVYHKAGGQLFLQGVLLDITERKQLERQLRELTTHLQTVREEEKAGIAREIHDDLGSTLTALKMGTHQLKAELSQDKNAKPLLEQVESLSQLINIAAGFTRHIISDLRPTILDDLGLLAAIEWQAAQFHKRTGIECRVNCIGDKGDLDKLRSIALFRILQEALTNVTRHSGASRVEIEFHHSDEEVVLSIHDNGCGLPEGRAVKSGSYGMLGMIERVEQLGGTIRFDTPPGGGLGVTVIFPLPAEKWSI
ncbi:MAG: response regulator [Betaproteobacteria bacterium]|nr:response regulator [Betaproteobacteria bacterium]